MPVDHATSLGDLVRDQPQAAALLERLDIDFCCGGKRTLEEACAERELDPATVAVLIDALPPAGGPEPEAHDVAGASISELCEHIVTRHHGPLHATLDRLTHRLATVARVHGGDHPEVVELQAVFATARGELEEHMRTEEAQLFPACRALDAPEATRDAAFDEALLALLEDDHAATGAALAQMRALSGDFDEDAALCSTHRTTLGELRAFEVDLHQHVHEENNILFPRVRARLSGDPGQHAADHDA
jgi:regulator of cell morphogenesis and NO signaling